MVFSDELFTFLCLPIMSSFASDYNDYNGVVLSKKSHLRSRECTMFINSVPYETKWLYLGTYSTTAKLCAHMNSPINSIVMEYKFRIRNQWFDSIKCFRYVNLDTDSSGKYSMSCNIY